MNDPHLFTKFIVFVYGVNVVNYIWCAKFGNAFYWLCAAGITVAATWLTK